MREKIKNILKRLGLIAVFRFLRTQWIKIVDLLGVVLFNILRVLAILPKSKKLNKAQIKKILLIRIDRVGDLVLTTPAISTMRKNFPSAEIHLLVNSYALDLVRNNPNVDQVLGYDKKMLLDTDYDLAICFHPGFLVNKLSFKAKATHRVGFSGRGGSFFLTRALCDDRLKKARHEVEFTLETLAAIGVKAENKKLEVSITPEGEIFAKEFYENNGLKDDDYVIVLHPGARQGYVRWHKEGYAQVADELINNHKAKIIMTGAENEYSLLNEIKDLMQNNPIIVKTKRLTELVSIMRRAKLYIGNITGPMHIACALDLPVVVITGMRGSLDDTRYWGPRCSDFEIVEKNMGCEKCFPGNCKTIACMQNITAAEVLAAVLRIKQRHDSCN